MTPSEKLRQEKLIRENHDAKRNGAYIGSGMTNGAKKVLSVRQRKVEEELAKAMGY